MIVVQFGTNNVYEQAAQGDRQRPQGPLEVRRRRVGRVVVVHRVTRAAHVMVVTCQRLATVCSIRAPISTGGSCGIAITLWPRLGRSQSTRVLSESRARHTCTATESVWGSFVDPEVHRVWSVLSVGHQLCKSEREAGSFGRLRFQCVHGQRSNRSNQS